MRKMIFVLVLILSSILCACGWGNSGPASGSVSLFATDDMSSYQQVITTINKLQLINKGAAGMTCDVLTTPLSLDLSNLSSTIQLLNVVDCPTELYGRIHIEFDKNIKLMDQNNTAATCSFLSYKNNLNQVNSLTCGEYTCSLDIDGSFNIFGNSNNELAIDFDLKELEIQNFPLTDCSATMKVSPLNSAELDFKRRNGYKERISGFISDLNTYAKSFNIVKGNKTFTVNYSGVSQQNIDQLLLFALSNNFQVKIESPSIDLGNSRYTASAVFIKVGGSISNLTLSNHTFTLTYQDSKTISVDYRNAFANDRVEGQLSNNTSVTAKLNGYDGKAYSAYQVAVTDSITED